MHPRVLKIHAGVLYRLTRFSTNGLRAVSPRREGGASPSTAVGANRRKNASACFPTTPTHSVEKSRNRTAAHHAAAAVSLGAGHPSDVAGAFGPSRVRNGEVAQGSEESPPVAHQACVGPLPTSKKGVLVQERSGRATAVRRLPNAGAEDRFSAATYSGGTKHPRDW